MVGAASCTHPCALTPVRLLWAHPYSRKLRIAGTKPRSIVMSTPQSHAAQENPPSESTLRWAKITGLAYLALFVSGIVGFLLIRQQLYVPDDATLTAAKVVSHEGLARLGIAVDLVTVLAQALAAVGFFLLFRRVDPIGAASITAFGLLNCVIVLMATAFSATALQVALRGGPTAASEARMLYDLNAAAWNAAGLFFGLWLIPMGWLTLRSGSMPRVLGWILVVGGVGGVLSPFVSALAPDASGLADVLPLAVIPGEVWIIGYLLIKGMPERPQVPRQRAAEDAVA